jgi:hypothetical protein
MKDEELKQIFLLQENMIKLREELLKHKEEIYIKGLEISNIQVESKKMLKQLKLLETTKDKLIDSHNLKIRMVRSDKVETPYIINSEILKKILEVEEYPIASFNLNTKTRILKNKDIQTKLTRKETFLLAFLAANINKKVERNQILNSIWDDVSYFAGRSLDVYMCKIRKLLQHDNSVNIVNFHGKGYKLAVN